MALRRGGSPAAASVGKKAARIEKKAAKAADKAERKARRAAEQAGDSVSRAAGTALAAVEAVTTDKPGRRAAKKARKEEIECEQDEIVQQGTCGRCI